MAHFSITNQFDGPDAAVLASIGESIAKERLKRNITQEELAEESGISRSTVRRLEAGESTQLTAFIRILRALDLLAGLELLLPVATASPMQVLENRGKARKRASSPRSETGADGKAESESNPNAEPWTWGDES
jgi:transcriptional regulator with XRE-family HTH domain